MIGKGACSGNISRAQDLASYQQCRELPLATRHGIESIVPHLLSGDKCMETFSYRDAAYLWPKSAVLEYPEFRQTPPAIQAGQLRPMHDIVSVRQH